MIINVTLTASDANHAGRGRRSRKKTMTIIVGGGDQNGQKGPGVDLIANSFASAPCPQSPDRHFDGCFGHGSSTWRWRTWNLFAKCVFYIVIA